MGDEHDGAPLPVELFEQLKHRLTRPPVQVAGGLVRQQQRRVQRQRPGDGHPLLLPAGQLGGPVPRVGEKAHLLQQPLGPIPPLLAGTPAMESGSAAFSSAVSRAMS